VSRASNRYSMSSMAGNSVVFDLNETWSEDDLVPIFEVQDGPSNCSSSNSDWSYIPSCLDD
jgi:hypothetical protein